MVLTPHKARDGTFVYGIHEKRWSMGNGKMSDGPPGGLDINGEPDDMLKDACLYSCSTDNGCGGDREIDVVMYGRPGRV